MEHSIYLDGVLITEQQALAREYKSRIDADRCTWQFKDKIRPQKPQASIEDLPLFGDERQKELF